MNIITSRAYPHQDPAQNEGAYLAFTSSIAIMLRDNATRVDREVYEKLSRLGVEEVECLKEWAHGVNTHEREVKEMFHPDIHNTGCSGDTEQCFSYIIVGLRRLMCHVANYVKAVTERFIESSLGYRSCKDLFRSTKLIRESLEDIANKVSRVYELMRPKMRDDQLVLVPVPQVASELSDTARMKILDHLCGLTVEHHKTLVLWAWDRWICRAEKDVVGVISSS